MQLQDEEINDIRRRMVDATDDVTAVTPELIASVAANFDDVAAAEEEEKHFKTVLWDKKSPINGVSAEDILEARDDIPKDGEVYLIIDQRNNQVIFFQPHEPGAEGFNKIKKSNWESIAGDHMKSIAKERARHRFHTELFNQVNESKRKSK